MAEFLERNGEMLLEGLVEHLVLVGIAVSVGLAISLALGLLIHRRPRLASLVTGATGLLYTIPSLALFAFLVPFTGLSLLTAEIGLVSYTLLILIRNIVAGLDGVPADIREAADGMGHTGGQRLVQVELPLAVPLILTGVRIATVTTVGLVTVTALIGEGGLGQVMLRAFNLQNWGLVYASVALMVVLAIALDFAILGIQRLLTPWTRAAGRSA
jgi:osmoprotectant transport system permease protein